MLLSSLSAGTPVFIDIERQGTKIHLISNVHDVTGGGILLKLPLKDISGTVVNITNFVFHEEDRVYVTSNGSEKSVQWECCTRIIKEIDGGKFLFLKADKSGDKYNRREAYRVRFDQQMDLQSITSGIFPITLLDLSIVGMGFTSEKKLNTGDILILNLKLDESEVTLTFKVVRVRSEEKARVIGEDEIERYTLYTYGASLLGKEDPVLVKYVMTKQLEDIRKRKLAGGGV